MKILLTGGTGLVGQNIREALASLPHITLLTPTRQELPLQSAQAVLDYTQTHKPDWIIHAAGRVGGIQANMAQPVEYLVDNLDMGRNIIMAAHQVGVPRLLNFASSCMYPKHATSPLQEDMLLTGAFEPTNEGYALAKTMCARLCEYISNTHSGRAYKTWIPCNLYGPFDKFDPRHSHLVPAIIHKIHEAKQEGHNTVEIWGDGTARREFLYAGDVAQAVVRAVEHFDSLPTTMNLGVGQDHSVNDYYQAVANTLNWQGQFVHNLEKPVGMQRKLLNISQQTRWGWAPAHSLAEGLAKTYAFYRTGAKR